MNFESPYNKWKQKRLKYLGKIIMGQAPSSDIVEDLTEGLLPFLQGTAEFSTKHPFPKQGCASPSKVAKSGNLLVSVRAPVGELNIADQDYGIGRGLCAVEFSKLDPRFGWWAIHHHRKQLNQVSTGSTYEAVAASDVGNIVVATPPFSEQHQIANYLDRETSQIDTLIKEKTRMLELIEEKRAALISRAVTRGLDPDADLKPSGLPWLRDIPVQWETMQLKRTWISAEYGISENIRNEGSIKVLRMTCIVDGKIDLTKAGEVEEVDESLLLRKGDLLFNRTNSLDQVAKVGLLEVEPEVPTSFASYLVRIRTNERTSGGYLTYLLNSSIFLEFARKNAIPAIGQANLNPTKYGEICIPLPPRQEQDEIINSITRERKKTSEMESTLILSIALLKERRSALITSAVTGQLELEAMNP